MNCCLVDLDHHGGSEWSFFHASEHTARKKHRCGECGETIQPGEPYELAKGKDENGWHSFKTCAACLELRVHFFCGAYIFGNILSDLRDEWWQSDGPDAGDLDGLSPAAVTHLERHILVALWADQEDAEMGELQEPEASHAPA